ncbi:MAG: sulfotransferase [Chloroflexota bacterium]|nr:sulfotransferase [Chloroflexota bacterium]
MLTSSTERRPEAVFVVGVNRSGTTLLRRLLETSPLVAVATETHFLGHVLPHEGARFYFRRLGDVADDATIKRLVEFIYSGEFQRRSRWREVSPYWRWLTREIPPEEFERALLSEERTERGIFRAMLRVYADHLGRPVPGEKTPAHLAYVDTLLEWFPDGRVVHMLRDPRAVYVSDRQRRRGKPRRPYSWLMKLPLLLETVLLVQTTWVWADAARRHRRYARRYPDRYRVLRFEDLVVQSEGTLPPLFEFLGLPLPEQPTDVKVVSRGFRWGESGLDAAAASRWREHIHPFADRWLRLWLGRAMRRHGY